MITNGGAVVLRCASEDDSVHTLHLRRIWERRTNGFDANTAEWYALRLVDSFLGKAELL